MSLVYTIGLALLDFNNRAKKLSYLALFKVHLFLTVFQRQLKVQTKVRSTPKDKHLGCIHFVGQLRIGNSLSHLSNGSLVKHLSGTILDKKWGGC